MRLGGTWLVALALCLCSVPAARANGRFPRAERLLEDPRDSNRLWLAATYGLLTTTDRGQNWHYLCEGVFAKQANYEGDPLLELVDDGALIVGVDVAVNRSVDHGCEWATALGGSQSEYIPDLTVPHFPNASQRAVLALHATLAGGRLVTRIERSDDAGETFRADPEPLALAPALTIDVAPSDSNFVYVSGLVGGAPVLLVSDDGGQTFRSRAIATLGPADIPYIAAVHPSDPRTLFVRTDGRVLVDERETANDALLVSRDSGETWQEVVRLHAQLLGFALAPAGDELLIGYGASGDAVVATDASAFGVYRANTTSFAWRRVLPGRVTCLTWTRRGAYVCTGPEAHGFALGFSPDLGASGEDFTLVPLLDLSAVRGPACCGANERSACAASWLTTCATLDACQDTLPKTCDPDSEPEPRPRPVVASGACACRHADGTSTRAEDALAFAAAALFVGLGRRRARIRMNADELGSSS